MVPGTIPAGCRGVHSDVTDDEVKFLAPSSCFLPPLGRAVKLKMEPQVRDCKVRYESSAQDEQEPQQKDVVLEA